MRIHWQCLDLTDIHACFVDFVITQPAAGTQWANGAANLVSWTKGVGDGVDGVDIEMSRLSQDGIIFVARDGECPQLSWAAAGS